MTTSVQSIHEVHSTMNKLIEQLTILDEFGLLGDFLAEYHELVDRLLVYLNKKKPDPIFEVFKVESPSGAVHHIAALSPQEALWYCHLRNEMGEDWKASCCHEPTPDIIETAVMYSNGIYSYKGYSTKRPTTECKQ